MFTEVRYWKVNRCCTSEHFGAVTGICSYTDSEWCFSITVPPPLLPPPVTTNETWRPSSPERGSLPSSDPGTRLFSAVRSLNDSVIMSPPDKFTNGELPELDEAGYASLILRTVKSDKVAEPVYERIKGERSISREYVKRRNYTANIESQISAIGCIMFSDHCRINVYITWNSIVYESQW